MTPSELKDILTRFGIRPIRDRGQHFLLDGKVIAAMVEAAAVKKGDRVIEIGPGPGILTEALLAAGAEVTAIELDRKLCQLLRDRFPSPNFHLVHGDILSFTNAALVSHFALRPASPAASYKVVANIPYAITSRILEKFLLELPVPTSLTIMVQREVADRILAGPGKMNSLSVLAQTLSHPRRVCNVPAASFFPPPHVNSAVIHMTIKSDAELGAFFRNVGSTAYFSIVRRAFADKRRQLKNSLSPLKADPAALEIAFSKAKISPKARPEELSVEQWVSLAELLTE